MRKLFKEFVDKYPEYPEAPDMLIEAAKIYERRLKDYEQAVSQLQLVIEKYPAHKKAKEAQRRIERIKKKMENNWLTIDPFQNTNIFACGKELVPRFSIYSERTDWIIGEPPAGFMGSFFCKNANNPTPLK